MPQYSVLLKTPLTAKLGYGEDGFALARAFHQHGLDMHLLPMSVMPPLPSGVAQLLVKEPLNEFDYFVHHTDPAQLGLTDGEKHLTAKKIAWTMWEFTSMSPEIAEDLADRLSGYDYLLVYDEISYQALEPFAKQAGVQMKILQGGLWAEEWVREKPVDWQGPFRFFMVGALHQRKNPFAAVKAFSEIHEEFPETELHLKTNVRTLHPAMEQAYPGLKIHYDIWPIEKLKKFYEGCHCYVAPSWGEGKNLPALQAQVMGLPVIYSDFGGHRQWASSDTGWPVGGTIEEHEPGMGSMRVDHDQLVSAMREAVSNRSLSRQKGDLGARIIPPMCDWSRVVERLLAMCV